MREPLRIAFSGASGTGKTTLAEHVSKMYGLPLCPTFTRDVAAEMGMKSPYDVDARGPQARGEFQYKVLERRLLWEGEHEEFVSDRSTYDVTAYTALHSVDFADETHLTLARQGWERYSHVFFCPMAAFFDLGDDPKRKSSRTYHEIYELMLRGLIRRGAAQRIVPGSRGESFLGEWEESRGGSSWSVTPIWERGLGDRLDCVRQSLLASGYWPGERL